MNRLTALVEKYKIASTLPLEKKYIEYLWKDYMTKEAPMGCLFLHNDFKSQIDNGEDIVLLHVSSNIEQIKKDKLLFSSGGGLGGVVYCAPVNSDGSPHNLTDFIIEKELPGFINSRKSPLLSSVGLIAIKIPSHLFSSNICSVVETNYIEFGKKYLSSYDRLLRRGKISPLKDKQVLKSLEKEFKNLLPFLELFCPSMYEVPMENFIKLLEEYIPKSDMVLNCYFEVILEYFYLHQNDENSRLLKNRGELNNCSVKEMIFDLVPELYEGFSTRKFKVKPSDFVRYFDENNKKPSFINNFNSNHFNLYLRWRLSYYIFIIMLDGSDIKKNHKYLSSEIMKTYPNLSGQLKYKIMQTDSHLVESEFSNRFLCSGSDLKIVSYKNIPKGELGLRMTKVNNDVKFFEAHISEDHKVTLGGEIDIKISSKLVSPQNGVMRNPTHRSADEPLYILAENKSLGSLQLMDRSTLKWIEKRSKDLTYKSLSKSPFLYRKDVEMLERYFPKENWFSSKFHVESIHGQRHIGRVSLFVLVLCNFINTSDEIKYSAFLASVVHDLRRLNDNRDIRHGDRSAKWLRDNIKLFSYLIGKVNIDVENAILAAKYHNYESSQIPDDLSDDCVKVTGILKTADALDRFRQPKESWWTNPDKLLEPSAVELILLARSITLRSESQHLNGVDSKTALLNSINSSKISII